jgi:hypothetical protein
MDPAEIVVSIRVRAVREGKSFKLGSLSVKPHPIEPQQEEAAN